MLEERIIPLLLCQFQGALHGKTRLQKLTFIIQSEAQQQGVTSSHFSYELYHYGPYSSELTNVIDDLKNEGFLNESMEMTPSGYTRYAYSLTDQGRKMLNDAKERNLISADLEQIIVDITSIFGDTPLPDLVNEAYRRFRK